MNVNETIEIRSPVLFSSATLGARWTELNQNRSDARKQVRFENACPKSGVIAFPTNRRLKNHVFRRSTSQLSSKLTDYVFRMNHDIDNQANVLQTTLILLHRLKMSWTLVHKRLKTRPAFLRTLRKFCILLHCQASQTEITKRNSTELCQAVHGQ